MMSVVRFSLMFVSLVLISCASEPAHYYTLLAPVSKRSVEPPEAPFLIDILPVGVPAQLDQPQLVVRQGNGSVAVLNDERWVAPLNDEMRTALSAQLTQRLHTQDVAGLSHTTNRPVMRIKIQIRRFDAWIGQMVQLDADWSATYMDGSHPSFVLVCRSQFDKAAPGDYPELVGAQQHVVADLAALIAVVARGWTRSSDANCSTP